MYVLSFSIFLYHPRPSIFSFCSTAYRPFSCDASIPAYGIDASHVLLPCYTIKIRLHNRDKHLLTYPYFEVHCIQSPEAMPVRDIDLSLFPA